MEAADGVDQWRERILVSIEIPLLKAKNPVRQEECKTKEQTLY